jgi:hypothetical protein
MELREIGWEGVDWIHVAQNWDNWQALVYERQGISSLAK